ncbi:MAG TPA: discoidin domain-containing protein, partial [Fodinibius sp.]|nr:discoidin domain-containing protein [Fodinibius sp.]
QLRSGHEDGTHWVPAEVNTSIRPGWYYHASEDHKVKSLPELMDVYYQSVGRNATFLLNLPVDPRGLVHEADSARLMQLADQIRKDFDDNLAMGKPVEASDIRNNDDRYEPGHVTDGNPETYWATDDGVLQPSLTIDLENPRVINRFLVQEYIQLGQRVKAFTVEALTEQGWKQVADETTIGYKRILRFPDIKASQVRFSVTDAKASPVISNIELYRAPKILSKPSVWRSHQDTVYIQAADRDAAIYYTTDGTSPSKKSQQYEEPFYWPQKGSIRAVVIDPYTGKSSPIATKKLDISKAEWALVHPAAKSDKAGAMWDGRGFTRWGTKISDLPSSITIDLGDQHMLDGVTYLPDQGRYASGIVRRYRIYVSDDGEQWQQVAKGEFSNIRNNPVSREVEFQALKGRYIKFEATDLVDDTGRIRVAEFGVSTD